MVNRYILDLYSSRISNLVLRNRGIYTLCQFAKSKELSASQIFNILKTTEYNAAYKNVNKKIQSFQEDGLIKQTKTIDREHNSIYYRLTPLGVFYLFYCLRGKTSLIQGEVYDIIIGMLDNYGDDEFFKLFVYPYFQKNTLLKLCSNTILEFFLTYFTEIAHRGLNKLFVIVQEKPEIIRTWLSELKSRLDAEERSTKEIHFNRAHVDTGETDKSDGYDWFFDDYLISYEIRIEIDNLIENTIILPIIEKGKFLSPDFKKYKYSSYESPDAKHWKNVKTDIALLTNDKKFHGLEATKEAFDKCYSNIMGLRQ